MVQNDTNSIRKTLRVLILSLLLFFFTVPHTLEDFTYGEPQKAGISPQILALGVAAVFALQGLALFWTGRQLRRGYVLHFALGILWPFGAGAAQLSEIFAPGPYRAGVISEVYVFGIIVVGILLALVSWLSMRGSMEATVTHQNDPLESRRSAGKPTY
ncbi:MAG TPA: hypothetical protein VFZ76_08540 [Anaerolineales bacterium]